MLFSRTGQLCCGGKKMIADISIDQLPLQPELAFDSMDDFLLIVSERVAK